MREDQIAARLREIRHKYRFNIDVLTRALKPEELTRYGWEMAWVLAVLIAVVVFGRRPSMEWVFGFWFASDVIFHAKLLSEGATKEIQDMLVALKKKDLDDE